METDKDECKEHVRGRVSWLDTNIVSEKLRGPSTVNHASLSHARTAVFKSCGIGNWSNKLEMCSRPFLPVSDFVSDDEDAFEALALDDGAR